MSLHSTFKQVFYYSLFLGLLSHCSPTGTNKGHELPNIVLILADDLGYGDIHANNPSSTIKTPRLDQLAAEGVNFLDAHTSSAVCTPSRYSLLTGRYPWRSTKKRGVLKGYDTGLIPTDQPTLATILKQSNYFTGIVGKWHLGLGWQKSDTSKVPDYGNIDYEKPLTYSPNDAGFDYSYIIPASLDFSPYVYIENKEVVEIPNDSIAASPFPVFFRKAEKSPSFDHAETLDHLLEKATLFIEKNSHKEHPFFLYFPLTAPHKPLLPHARFRNTSEAGWYGDFVQQVDWTVGQVLSTLEKNNLADNTLVIFSSDNGSYMRLQDCTLPDHLSDSTVQAFCPENHQPNHSWRGTKADIYEAGHRVPLIVRWGGQIESNSFSNTPVCLTDITATIADLIGTEIDRQYMPDSYSFAAALKNTEGETRPPVIHQSGNGTLAIRSGEWKLVLSNGSGGRQKPVGSPFTKPFQLYNLQNDPTEKENLWNEKNEQAQYLEKVLHDIVGSDLSEKDIEYLRED